MAQPLDYRPGLNLWASQMLARFDAILLPEDAERQDLRAAGVSASQIEALFPFDIDAYRPGVARVTSQPVRSELAYHELIMHPDENAQPPVSRRLWNAIPMPLMPELGDAALADDPHGEQVQDHLLTIIAALYMLQRWPFSADAIALGFNGRTFAEDKMRQLASNFDAVNASLERILRLIAPSASEQHA